MTFWTLQEYAQTPDPSTEASRWGTWWGKFHPADAAPPTGLTATADNATQVTLRWTDLATNETGYSSNGRSVRRGRSESSLPPLPPNSITYTDNAGLAAGTTYTYRVGAIGSNGTSYSIEVPVKTLGSPATSGGGGGGGCQILSRSGGGPSFAESLGSIGFLLLPAATLGLRRFSRRFARKHAFRHPAC